AYIVSVIDHPYLATRLPLWLTLSSYASTTPVVLAVRDASTGEGIGLTCVRSAVRFLGYRSHDHWRPHTCVRPAYHVGSATSAGQLSEGAMMWRPGHYVSYQLRFRCHETARVMATGASTARTGRKAGRPASSRGSYGERSRGSTKDRTGTDELACLLCPDTTAAAEVDNTARATSEAQAVVAVGFARTRRGSRRTLPVYRTPAWPWLLRHASLLLHNRRLSKPPPPPP
ncbi:hypothetical protein BHM03_00026158, partial [Ensete ventricosum]